MNKRIFLVAGGGFGDFLRDYFQETHHWGFLQGLKALYPETQIKVMASVHNPALENFFSAHPYVDKVENYGWRVEGWELFTKYREDYVYIKDIDLSGIPWITPQMYLSKSDDAEFLEIYSKGGSGKRIVIHPFGVRRAMPLNEFPYLIDRLIDDLQYTVITIGGTHIRLANINGENKVDGGEQIVEEFTYERPGLINLVNKTNIRVTLKTLQTANGFIGHGSCFNMMAWLHSVKNVVFSRGEERELLKDSRYGWPIIQKLPWCKNFFSDEWGEPKNALNEAVAFFA